MNGASVPSLTRGTHFRFDGARGQWTLLAPERAFVADETATEVLKLIDRHRTLGEIVDALAARYEAPRNIIEADVMALVDSLREKGLVQA